MFCLCCLSQYIFTEYLLCTTQYQAEGEFQVVYESNTQGTDL